MSWFFGTTNPQKTYTSKELERTLLSIYTKREPDIKKQVDLVFEDLVATGYDMNSVSTGGPLFCFILDMKPLLTVNLVNLMLNGGLDFSHAYTRVTAHKKMFLELEINYSDTLWSVFITICQQSNFVDTIPFSDLFDILFGKITVERGVVTVEREPILPMFDILLAYDKRHKRIKKYFLSPRNFSLRHCVKSKYPLVYNAILNS
jgi:hypothetical protein